MQILSAAGSDVGHRANNEDSHFTDCSLGLHLVADGMGGYEGGEVASSLAAQTVAGFILRNTHDRDATWPYGLDRTLSFEENLLATGIRIASSAVHARRQGRLSKMGSTIAALYLHERHATVAHVGDSRVYRMRNGILEQLTCDHSLWNELRRTGMDLPDRSEFRQSNVITRAVGIAPTVQVDLSQHILMEGDRFVLCSDGLTETVTDEQIAWELSHASVPDCTLALLERARTQGTQDNTTVIVVGVAHQSLASGRSP